MGTQPLPKKGAEPFPIFGKFLLCPNGWMHHDATWYGGRPQPRHFVFDGDPAPPQKGGGAPSPIFGPCLLWPNGWMDQDATWHGVGPWCKPHCARWGPSFPSPKGAHPQFSSNVRCGQTTGWTKMALGMEVGLGPGDFVYDGDSATARTEGTPTTSQFWPMLIVAKRLDG